MEERTRAEGSVETEMQRKKDGASKGLIRIYRETSLDQFPKAQHADE